MLNLSSVYFVEHLNMFQAYLQPIVRRYTIWLQQLVLIVLFRWLLSWLGWNNKYQLLYPHTVPPDDGLYIRLKHLQVFDEIYWR